MDGQLGTDGMSWWVGLNRQDFAAQLQVEAERLRRLDLTPTAAGMASHRRPKVQRENQDG